MKKRSLLIAFLACLTVGLVGCFQSDEDSTSSTEDSLPSVSESVGDSSSDAGNDGADDSSDSSESGGGNESGDGNESGGDNETGGDNESSGYLYTDFTASEKETFTQIFGEVIPFVANDDYYVEAYSYEDETGVNFYTFGNTQADFDAYREKFSSYTFVETYLDEYDDTWYVYQKGEYYVDLAFYKTEDDDTCIDVYAYFLTDDGSEEGGDNESSSYLYTDFTASEKETFTQIFGEVIPFVANDDYYVEAYSYEDETGVNFYTFGNTLADFDAYREKFSSYTFVETYLDEYDDTWYVYQKGEYYVDLAFYKTEDDDTCIDVYAYFLTDDGSEEGGGNESGGGSEEGGDQEDTQLPEGTDGVYDVDFTKATNVKDVTDQGYYLDGCPTVGKPGVLVIPVEFSDATAASKGYEISVLKQAFEKGGKTDYYSVYDYYNISSYGQLELDITVLDSWFRPKNDSTYYQNAMMEYFGEQVAIGDQLIMNEALAYLESVMDLSAFDSDGNRVIDAVVLINTLDVGDDDFHWAYRYWNIYTNDDEEYYEYDGVSANDYLWASYQFLNEGQDLLGNTTYDDENAVNTYTYIHEFGHILGSDDYYDTAGVNEPMGGYDVMDYMTGDHNAYTKFNLGWVTSSRLVTTDTSVTLTVDDFSKAGDTVIIANNWDETLGAYQEYFILVYYRSVGLNSGEGGYFEEDGIVVYHVNAVLTSETYDGETYYDVKNNNTDPSDEYGSEDNLIEYVTHGGAYVYGVGDSLPTTEYDNGSKLQYTFTVDGLTEDSATVTVSKIS